MSVAPSPILEPEPLPSLTATEHAMLVVWGLFARQIGLVEKLRTLCLPQRKRDHAPQTKLIQFLVAILGGCEYLQDMSRGPHPLVKDSAVAEAWGQPGWADYSGVSRTLKASSAENVQELIAVLNAVSQPFVDREVTLALRDTGLLVYDGDLTCRPVSNTSTSYAGAAFGWMSDEVGLGFQAAVVTLRSPTYGRLILSGEHHPGDVVSATQAEALVRAAEARTGVRPQRRPELLVERISRHRQTLAVIAAKLQRSATAVTAATARVAYVAQQCDLWQARVTEQAAAYQAKSRPERPHSRLAQARRKLNMYTRRLRRRQGTLQKTQRRAARWQAKLQAAQAELEQWQARHTQLVADNASNPAPVRVIIRLDAGFGSGPNVALLIELGYEVYCKANNAQVSAALRQRITAETVWTRVGANAEMIAWSQQRVANCPYPLEVALERFHVGNDLRHSTLLHFGPTPVTADLPAWFQFYNGRQLIEAGNKEGKGVFQIRHLKVRSLGGLAIQEQFTFFAANLVRWAAEWLRTSVPKVPAPFNAPRVNVKQMVRVAANTSAWVISGPHGMLLRFAQSSLFAGGWFLGYITVPKQIVQAQPPNKQAAAIQPTPYVPRPPSIKGIDAALLKARWGLEFTPAEPNAQPHFTKEQILDKAYEFDPLLKQATSVDPLLGYLRNPGLLEAARRGEKVFPEMADSGLAWILVFEGYSSVSSGPHGAVHGHSNEINYVFSAITGEYIQAFIYR